jgi:5'-3' exoribonuclease 2
MPSLSFPPPALSLFPDMFRSVHYDMPTSSHIHKSMLLRGVKMPAPALSHSDIEVIRGKARRSGRSYGGVPLKQDNNQNGGRGRNEPINYGPGGASRGQDSRGPPRNNGYPPARDGYPIPPPGWMPPPGLVVQTTPATSYAGNRNGFPPYPAPAYEPGYNGYGDNRYGNGYGAGYGGEGYYTGNNTGIQRGSQVSPGHYGPSPRQPAWSQGASYPAYNSYQPPDGGAQHHGGYYNNDYGRDRDYGDRRPYR